MHGWQIWVPENNWVTASGFILTSGMLMTQKTHRDFFPPIACDRPPYVLIQYIWFLASKSIHGKFRLMTWRIKYPKQDFRNLWNNNILIIGAPAEEEKECGAENNNDWNIFYLKFGRRHKPIDSRSPVNTSKIRSKKSIPRQVKIKLEN